MSQHKNLHILIELNPSFLIPLSALENEFKQNGIKPL